jgi:hypothetical protein
VAAVGGEGAGKRGVAGVVAAAGAAVTQRTWPPGQLDCSGYRVK